MTNVSTFDEFHPVRSDKNTISDSAWHVIAREGNLPPEAREEVEGAIRDYRLDDGAEYNRVTPETRETLSRARKPLAQLAGVLRQLEGSLDFRMYNTQGDAETTSLAQDVSALAVIEAKLDQARKRLAKRSRKNWPRMKLRALFIELLEIRTQYLKIDVPIQAKETTFSGYFHGYLDLCLQLAERHANKYERAEMLKRGIDLAVISFQLRRATPLYSWQWPGLFPQTWLSLCESIKGFFE